MDNKLIKDQFFQMLRIRKVELKISELYPEEEMRCPVHLSVGQEAVAVGVCSALQKKDIALSAHRSHAHYLAKGGDLKSMLAELYGKKTGCAEGKGGSMHLIDLEAGLIAAVPIVGSTIPIAVGSAWGNMMQDKSVTTAVFFGEGATETGVFHESLGFASLHNMPMIFVCENNLYSVYSSLEVRQSNKRNNIKIAEGHGIVSLKGEGNDVSSVYGVIKESISIIKKQKGPVYVEFDTYRWLEHCGPNDDDHLGYRKDKEVKKWKINCPIEKTKDYLLNNKLADEKEIQTVSQELDDEIEEAFEFAKTSPFLDKKHLYTSIYSD
tara:strand:- start:11875 stop:12843 length:969 start_codon:yes stop_codon:yes gene_type:complete